MESIQISVTKNGENFGPYTLEELAGYIEEGRFGVNDLAWREGMTDWQPISQFLNVEFISETAKHWMGSPKAENGRRSKTMNTTTCPQCGLSQQFPSHYLGRQIKCRECGGQFFAQPLTESVNVAPPSAGTATSEKISNSPPQVTGGIYLYSKGQQLGPYVISQLQSMWRSGAITSEDQYWQEGGEAWHPITSLQNILSISDPPISRNVSVSQHPSPAERSDTLGLLILLIPAIAATVAFSSSVSGVIEVSSPIFNGIIIGTTILTAMLIAIEAGQLGMGKPINGRATTGPIAWFFGVLLLWIFVFPAYLFSRRKFGVRDYFISGIFVTLAFTATPFISLMLSSDPGTGLSKSLATPEMQRQTIEETANWVRESLTEKCRTDDNYADLEVVDVVLVRESSSRFTGYVEFRYDGETDRPTLTVIEDGQKKLYQCEPPRSLIMKREMKKLGGMLE
jgi:hypothetical protein